jgi:hypothetical protein
MIRPDIPYRTCSFCEYIEDCEHPSVDDFGSPIPPNDCPKSDKIKLVKRTDDLLPKE